MPSAFEGVRAGDHEWSYASLVQSGLDDVVDDEGRPITERRAASAVKQGVPMVLKSCPYPDERFERPMNVSALAQVVRHFDAVLADIAAFRAALRNEGAAPGWEAVLTTVTDQLGAPALYLLRHPNAAKVPVRHAVAHKLAAGYFGVVRGLFADGKAGIQKPVSVDDLLSYAHVKKAFMGASEACGGPPPLIRRATEAMLHGGSNGEAPTVDPVRLSVARTFRQQIQIGIAWERFDAVVEREVLDILTDATPKTPYFGRALEDRRRTLSSVPPRVSAEAATFLPTDLPREPDIALRTALTQGEAKQTLVEGGVALQGDDAGAVVFRSVETRARLTERLRTYVEVHAEVVRALVALEAQLRNVIETVPSAPIELHVTVLPKSAAQHWMEGSLGCRVFCTRTSVPVVRIVPLSKPTIATGWTLGRP